MGPRESIDSAHHEDESMRLMRMVQFGLAAAWLACAAPIEVFAQTSEDAALLGRAYAALAAGRGEEAEALAAQVLARSPRDHGAAGLAVSAAARRGAAAALEVYERWLGVTRHEDAFVLEPAGVATLRALGNQTSNEDEAARQLLARLDPDEPGSETQRAEDRARELSSRLGSDEGGSKTLALREIASTGSAAALPQILPLLKDPAPDTRAAAAETLGKLRASQAVPALQQALTDPASEVRSAAAIALYRLGDASGDDLVNRLLTSDIPDLRLQAAEGMVEGPSSAWVPYVEPLLNADAPMTRLTAARLMLDVDPVRAGRAIAALLDDANPVVAGEVARTLVVEGLKDLPTIRRLLKHPAPAVRLQGATALLRLTGAIH
jgi:HEAT repeat protein